MKCKGLTTTKFGKGSLLLIGIGLVLLTIGIVCAAIGYEEDDYDDSLLIVGTAFGISFGVFCLISGALVCLCQDCCCCCMRPYPPVHRVPVSSQQQYSNGLQPIHQPLHQQQPWQPYLTSQSNAGLAEHPPPYEALPPVNQHQGTPLDTNQYYSYQEKTARHDHLTTPLETNTSSSFGTTEDSRGFMSQMKGVGQGYINPVFPEPQGIAYQGQATVPSAPVMDLNPPLYRP